MNILIIAFAMLVLLVLAEVYRELHCFQVKEYRVEASKLTGLDREYRIVFLSDLHNHVYGKDNDRLLSSVKAARPDLILIGGDMLVGKKNLDYRTALSFVERLTSLAPVYYANGNHEQRMKEKPDTFCVYPYADYHRKLVESGVHFLENESVSIELTCAEGKKTVVITGLEIPLHSYKRAGRGQLTREEIVERIGEKRKGVFQILLAHNPSFVKEYVAWGADLILSGHLHGGVVRIPGLLGMVAPSLQWFPRYSGDLYREGGAVIVVSKGLGTHTINFRLFNPAEVVVLHLGNKSCEK